VVWRKPKCLTKRALFCNFFGEAKKLKNKILKLYLITKIYSSVLFPPAKAGQVDGGSTIFRQDRYFKTDFVHPQSLTIIVELSTKDTTLLPKANFSL